MRKTTDAPVLIHDRFESEIFGKDVLRLACSDEHDAASIRREATRAIDLVGSGSAALVSSRLPEGHPGISLLLSLGFRQIERLVRFERPVGSGEQGCDRIRLGTPEDQQACVAISGTAFRWDRFHADPHISDRTADDIKIAWVRNFFDGRSDLLLVGDDGSSVCGFLNCLVGDAGEAVIDLIAVAESHQGRGWGTDLVRTCLARLQGTARTLAAGTQADNVGSVRMYQRLGFRPALTSVTLHLTRDPIG